MRESSPGSRVSHHHAEFSLFLQYLISVNITTPHSPPVCPCAVPPAFSLQLAPSAFANLSPLPLLYPTSVAHPCSPVSPALCQVGRRRAPRSPVGAMPCRPEFSSVAFAHARYLQRASFASTFPPTRPTAIVPVWSKMVSSAPDLRRPSTTAVTRAPNLATALYIGVPRLSSPR